ncbi:MAG TPA: bifunctional nuclease domain-containing protein [Gaiellaceae bacterium]|nr:bifunctional nuclease domain-containing protein [Gaiellaceae bacterium]
MRNDDVTLVGRALAGDRAAFGELVERHRPRVRALAFAVVGGREEADDVVQEALLRAYLGLGSLRDPARFGSWLGTIAVNLARMRRRRPARETMPLDELAAAAPDDPELGVGEALAELPPDARELLVLHYVEGVPCAELAEQLGVSAGAVRVRLHRARGRLRTLLPTLASGKETEMIEVTLEDVYVRVAPGDPSRLAEERLRIVLLRERDGERRLPIWIGPPEGDALTLLLRGESLPRPLTFDLTVSLLAAVGATVERVVVTRLEDKTFYAVVAVKAGGETHEVDARPSDALNLAARTGSPIFVDGGLLQESGVVAGDAIAVLECDALEGAHERELADGDWQPHSIELVKSFWQPGRK